jgi:hypothetical protein
MESSGRNPAKHAQIMADLESIMTKPGKKYSGIESRIKSGDYRYRKHRNTLKRNRASLQKNKNNLTTKLRSGKSKQKKANQGRIEKIDRLLTIIDDETNVEKTPNVKNEPKNERGVVASTPGSVSQEANVTNAVQVVHTGLQIQQGPREGNGVNNGTAQAAPCSRRTPEILDALPLEGVVAEVNQNRVESSSLSSPTPKVKSTPFLTAVATNQTSERSKAIANGGICTELFDPCTREPIANGDINILESRVKDIKNLRLINSQDHPEVIQFPVHIRTRLDLLLDLLNSPSAPSPAIFKYTINGQLYEALWDIVFSLHLLDEYPDDTNFFMINKKAEALRPEEEAGYTKNSIEYLKGRKVNEGPSGASDITFCYKNTRENLEADGCSAPLDVPDAEKIIKTKFYFCSSKFYKKDASKSAESFDIQKIYTAVKSLHQDFDVRIILLVKNKEAVDKKLKNARNKYISEEASKVYGEEQLFTSLLKIYTLAKLKIEGEVTEGSLRNALGISEKVKPILSPRLHQHIAILKIQHAIQQFKISGGNNKFLVGILPRGGKTYIAGGIVSILQPTRVVVLLGAKSETISQFTKDLFLHYQDFADYNIVDVLENSADTEIDPTKKYIFVMSVELYKTESSKRRILQELKGGANRADLFICDEAHLKQTTPTAIKEMEEGTVAPKSGEEQDAEEKGQLAELDKTIAKDVPVIYMTGTYIKPLTVFEIPDKNVVIWEYQDIQEGKYITDGDTYFKQNFPDFYQEALEKCFAYGETFESIQAMYRKFPNLYLLSTQFTEDAKDAFLQQSKGGEKVGFPTITHLFQVKKGYSPESVAPSLWHTGFTNPGGITRLINYLSPKSLQLEEGGAISSVMERIDNIAQRIGDRLAFFTKDFVVHSQLWFLPSMNGHPLIKRMTALAGVIFQSPWYKKHFNVLAVSSSVDWSKIPGAKDMRIKMGDAEFIWACPRGKETLKACILREETSSRKNGKGLIILAQNMLQLGISLTCVDIVVLLDAGEKVDERIQKMYRALTESTNKKGGFIVDMNYFRTVTAIMNYTIQASKTRQKKEVYADSGLRDAFNSVIKTYSIDDDLPIYGTIEEGGGRIERETLPELRRMLQIAPKGRTDGLTITAVGQALNRNVEDVLKGEYNSKGLNHILGELAEDPAAKTLREAEEGVERAEELEDDEAPSRPPASKLFPNAVAANPAEKRKAFMDIFKTTLKLGIFGTEYKTITELIDGLRTDIGFQEIVFDTLIKRGAIKEGADITFVNRLIIAELEKIVRDKKDGSYSGMKDAFNSRDTQSQKFQEVLKYIVDHLTPKETERAKFGEVFTPLVIVDEMLSKLPTEVWSNKDMKWLDPANGIGNFPIKAFLGQSDGPYIYSGLYEGLRKVMPDDDKRCKHIIENMLFMVDINGKNNLIAKRLFEKLCPGAKANIEQIDKKRGFLVDKDLSFNGTIVKSFDIIMGNPPFNVGGLKSQGDSGATTIWPAFVEKSYALLENNGYLIFLHPPQWRVGKIALYKKIHTILTTNQILYLRSYEKDKKLGAEKFENTDVRFEYYILQKKKVNENTIFIDIFENETAMMLSDLPYIPNAGYTILSKLFKARKKYGELQFVDGWKKIKGVGRVNKITNMSETNGLDYIVESANYENQERCKVCTNGETSRWPVCFIDKGSSSKDEQFISSRYILCSNETTARKVAQFLSSKIVMFLVFVSHFQIQARTPAVLYTSLPNVEDINIDFGNDEEIYDYFNISVSDRKMINDNVQRKRVLTNADIHKNRKSGTRKTLGGGSDKAQGGGAKQRRFTRKLKRT